MRHFSDTFLEPAVWFAADWSLRWAALLVLVAMTLWILRPRRAALRQLLLWVALIAGLLVPFSPRWGGVWERTPQLPEPSPTSPSPTSPSFPRSAWERTPGRSASRATPEPNATQSVAPVRSHAERGNEREPPSESLGSRRLIVLGIASCWCLAVAYLLMRHLCGWIFLRGLRRDSVEATGTIADLFVSCRAELHVGKAVRLATHPDVRSPILLGWLRPCIIVPTDWPQRSIQSQRAALLHELAHVRRRDHLLAPLLDIIRIAFFFHPLVRSLLAQLEHERELLCDEMVVRLGIDRRDYARLLLEFGRSSGRLAWPAVSLPMSRRRTVKIRIYHLLEDDMERWIRPLPVRWAVVLGAGLLTLSLGLASYRAWAEEKKRFELPDRKAEQQLLRSKPAESAIQREDLRYGGKDFNQWRTDTLTELKGSIRVDGMKAFAAFGANGYGPEATQAILEIMRGYDTTQKHQSDDDSAVLWAAYQAVAKIGPAALSTLTQAVEEKNRNERHFAVQALEQMRSDARSAVPVLLKAMKNEDIGTRLRALDAVRLIDSHAKGFVPALIEALKDKDERMRSTASATLSQSGIVKKVKHTKSAIPALLEALQDQEAEVRLNALGALNTIGPEKHGIGMVSQLLQDDDGRVQRAAYYYLRSLGPDGKEAVPAIIAELKKKPVMWTVPIETLAAIGPAARDAIPELTQLLQSERPDIRESALKALKQISPDNKRWP
jgi:beta-lactamase regulating signal transducer with metallopeptidase domain/HEAT repeat protein